MTKKAATVNRQLAPFMLRAAVQPETLDEKERTFEILASTGERVLRYQYDLGGYFWEELSMAGGHVRMEKLNNSAPFLDNHSRWSLSDVLGAIEPNTAKVGSKGITAKVRMSSRDEVAPVFRDIKDRILNGISAGYRVYKYEEMARAEDGRRVMRAVDWEPYEVSLVVIPAETGSGIRSDQTQKQVREAETNTCEFLELTREAQGDEGAMTEEEKRAAAAAQAQALAQQNTEASRAAVDAARAEGVASEKKRQDGIRSACEVAKVPADFTRKLLDDPKMTLDGAREAIFAEMARADATVKTDGHQRTQVTMEQSEKRVQGAQAWLVRRAALDGVFANSRHDDYKALAKADPGEFRGMTLLDIARMFLEDAGVRVRGRSGMEIAGLAFTTRSASQSTSDFATLLENLMNKSLRAQYEFTPDTWSQWCSVGSVPDFRSQPQYKVGAFGVLEDLTELGEIRRKRIQDGKKEVIQAGTKANIISISREAIINDDMDVFTQLPAMLGRSAKLTIEKFAYALLASGSGAGPTLLEDTKAVFHVDHGNLVTGAAPTVDVVDGMRIALGRQKDLSGNEFLNVVPRIILCALEYGGKIKVINDSTYDPDIAGKIQVNNKVRGVVSKVIDTPQITGNAWYMFADPGVTPVFKIVFLNGAQEPFMEAQRGWEVDGTELKCRIDFGGGAIDFRGAVRNPGP